MNKSDANEAWNAGLQANLTYIWEACSLRVWIPEFEWEPDWSVYHLCDLQGVLNLSELQLLHL